MTTAEKSSMSDADRLIRSCLIADKSGLNGKFQVDESDIEALYYDPFLDEESEIPCIVSVDNVRLNINFNSREDMDRCIEMMCVVQCDGTYEEWTTTAPNKYRYMYKFPMGGSAVMVGIGINPKNCDIAKISTTGFIEFNPNKVAKDERLKMLMNRMRRYVSHAEVSRWDVATDVAIPRKDARMRKDMRGYEYLNKNRGITEYLGTRQSAGYCKLYDKNAERLVHDGEVLETPMTRLEMTVGGDMDTEQILDKMPDVYAWHGDGERDESTRNWVRAVGVAVAMLNDADMPIEPVLGMLSRDARNKVETWLNAPKVKPSAEAVEHAREQAHSWVDDMTMRYE